MRRSLLPLLILGFGLLPAVAPAEDPSPENAAVAAEELPPLLGSSRARHVWEDFCADQPDDAPLPVDPRTLVQPGAFGNSAVFFNAYYEDCHVNLPDQPHAQTCGEYRSRRDRGYHFLLDELPTGAMSAGEFNNLWKKWGFEERPENFDELYTLRYGLNHAPYPNPYPLPGEDPNATDGGSGQLPMGLRQLKDDNGRWTGQIGTGSCFTCHGGSIGDPRSGEAGTPLKSMGLGNNNYDYVMYARDNAPWGEFPLLADNIPSFDLSSAFNVGIRQRGQNNAVGAFLLLNTILDVDSLGPNPNPLKTASYGQAGVQDALLPLAHTQDTPAWWNFSHRPRKFFDAGVSSDSTRIIMAAGVDENSLASHDGKPYRSRVDEYDQDVEAFLISRESPAFPGEIDEDLAEKGAVLFHTLDLFALPGNEEHPKPPGGNGSCASCHGAYSPRYVNDPAYLEDPRLEGIAAHISPLAVIGTDRARSDMLAPTLREAWDTTFWGFPEGAEGWTHPDDKDPMTELADDMYPSRPKGVCGWEKGTIGYLAPPLYGTWATAPYFHNGSVPTIEQVLDSGKRPNIWRRLLQTDGAVSGFDQRLATAYDFERLGWKHDVLTCDQMPGTVAMNCNPVDDGGPSLVQLAQNVINAKGTFTGLVVIPDPAPGGLDKRLIFDTRILGNDEGGHTFTDALTDFDRKAIIEYLKTL